MDYLTCLGYNPPKASIRIIASSSSRLRGCSHSLHDLVSTERRRERKRETGIPLRSSSTMLGVSSRYRTRALLFPFYCPRGPSRFILRLGTKHRRNTVSRFERDVSPRHGETSVRTWLSRVRILTLWPEFSNVCIF